MKKRILAFCMTLIFCVGIFGEAIPVSAASVYTISSLGELKDFAEKVNAGNDFSSVKVVLTQDIYMNAVTDGAGKQGLVFDGDGNLLLENADLWMPIGTETNPFRGTFDGKGYKIYGMVIDGTSDLQGLFGVVENAVIYNVYVSDSYIKGNFSVGAVIGAAKKETVVSNCRNYYSYVCADNKGGGVIGWTEDSHAYNCTSYGTVYSRRCAGGVVGDVYSNGQINNCVNFGTVDGKELVGAISGGSTKAKINNCLNAGNVLYSGGYMIAGGDGSRTINNCYSLQNDSVNKGLTMGTDSATALTFSDESAQLSKSVSIDGVSYTKVVDALNAWVKEQADGNYYSDWEQGSGLPYLEDKAIGSVKSMNENTFSDVDPEKWYYDEVKYVYDNGLMTGTSQNKFSPETDTSRAMVVTILYRQEGEPEAPKASFTDVSDNQWYTAAVGWASENGIVKGFGDGTFGPNVAISREQMAAIIHRYSKYKGIDISKRADLSKFADAHTVGSWAKENMQWAVAEGLINGINGNLRPQAEAERAQVAAVLMRYCTK